MYEIVKYYTGYRVKKVGENKYYSKLPMDLDAAERQKSLLEHFSKSESKHFSKSESKDESKVETKDEQKIETKDKKEKKVPKVDKEIKVPNVDRLVTFNNDGEYIKYKQLNKDI